MSRKNRQISVDDDDDDSQQQEATHSQEATQDYVQDDLLECSQVFSKEGSKSPVAADSDDDGDDGDKNVEFPDSDDDEGDEMEKSLSWKDVPMGMWYRIRCQRWIITEEFGRKLLVILENPKGAVIEAWVPKMMSEHINLKAKMRVDDGKDIYVKTIGMKKTKNGRHEYYDYKLKSK